MADNEYAANRILQMDYSSRIPLYLEGFKVFSENPLGVGVGNFGLYSIYSQGVNPHNIFIEAFVELGIFGCGFFLFIIFNSFYLIVRFIKKSKILSLDRELHFLLFTLVSISIFILLNLNKSYSLTDFRFILIPLSIAFSLTRKNA